MRKCTLQLQDVKGNVLEENEISINDNDVLVMQISEDTSLDVADCVFKALGEALETGNMLGIPHGIKFFVIKKS